MAAEHMTDNVGMNDDTIHGVDGVATAPVVSGVPAARSATMFARNDGLTAEQDRLARTWTYIDEDLDGVEPAVADYVRTHRISYAHNDLPRDILKRDLPDDVVLYADIPYTDDGADTVDGTVHGHRLDVLLPKDAVYRGGAPIPTIVEIHGGAFFYEFKELNRSHAARLAEHGYAVVSMDYRLYPAVDLLDQLADLSAALGWVKANAARYMLDWDRLFITADSAGVVESLYLMAAEHNAAIARALGLDGHGARFHAAGFKSAMVSLDHAFDESAKDPGDLVALLRPCFDRLVEHLRGGGFDRVGKLVAAMAMPPVWMATSTDDFLESSSLELAVMLRDNGVDHQLIDCRAKRNQCLPHNFMAGMPWLEESRECVDSMIAFFDEHQPPRTHLVASK